MHYSIKRPKGQRKSFGLVCYRLIDRRQKEYLELPKKVAEDLAAINAAFKKGTYAEHEAETLVRELIEREQRKQLAGKLATRAARLSDANEKLFKNYWRDEYEHRELADSKSMRWKLQKALRLIEPLSLQTAERSELAERLKRTCETVNERRHAIDRLNQLLKYAKRGFKLTKPPEEYGQVEYVTEADLKKLTDLFDDKRLVDFAWTLFGTGARLSEGMALLESDVRDDEVSITKQRTAEGKTKKPKRGKTGTAAILPGTLPYIKRWVKLDFEVREEFRYELYEALDKACRELKLGKTIGPHDLRHSHAIYLLERGLSLGEVANQLRNTIAVCQKYYTGFEHTPGTIDRLKMILNAGATKRKR